MKLNLGDIWISKEHPHENFKVYAGIVDSCHESYPFDVDSFDNLPESAKILFWERTNNEAFDKFLDNKLGENRQNNYPYGFCGETKKSYLVNKIKKFNMELSKERCVIAYGLYE